MKEIKIYIVCSSYVHVSQEFKQSVQFCQVYADGLLDLTYNW